MLYLLDGRRRERRCGDYTGSKDRYQRVQTRGSGTGVFAWQRQPRGEHGYGQAERDCIVAERGMKQTVAKQAARGERET